VLPIHKGKKVKRAQLRGALKDGTQRRARCLLDVVEEDDRTLWRAGIIRLAPAVITAAGSTPAASFAAAASFLSWRGRQQAGEEQSSCPHGAPKS
jgi:hypothetical protein